MAVTFRDFKTWLLSLVGDHENTARDVKSYMDQLSSETITHTWLRRTLVLAALDDYSVGQTVSLSASAPLGIVPIFVADKACRVDAAYFLPYVSATVTATDTMGYHLLVTRTGSGVTFSDGNGSATLTSTHSATSYVAGVSSTTSKFSTASHSFSALTQNVANAPNPLLLNPAANALQLFPGDVLRAQVLKGSGTATDSGAIFRGGVLKIRVVYGESG